ncbi:CHC2 zinc finger domain-containing protein [Lacrimispora sp.]|uniref:CHC2 zinc finger domain-containing protein n=1 Tax=Lacrimispora sp. TaxID=2719234 RepID=UPI0028A91138|nr:CHC2 zinc finger domain-containing protein [Lacrimispora sp.]
MTVEEIKGTYSMRDIVARYGFQPNRSGFIPCPFHEKDRQASLKVYDRDFHCHACGANGDIFTFVQMMDDLSFKEAYQSLGGTYEKPTFASRLVVYKSQKRRDMLRKEQERLRGMKGLNGMLISIYRAYMERSEPFSDVWCDSYNALQYQLYVQAELNEIEARW